MQYNYQLLGVSYVIFFQISLSSQYRAASSLNRLCCLSNGFQKGENTAVTLGIPYHLCLRCASNKITLALKDNDGWVVGESNLGVLMSWSRTSANLCIQSHLLA